jgi:hypothetical protein
MPTAAGAECLLEIGATAHSPGSGETLGLHCGRPAPAGCVEMCSRYAGDDTVSRLRPLARRRFNTSRPFFVLMRTRKP